jgi:hypothetical protein
MEFKWFDKDSREGNRRFEAELSLTEDNESRTFTVKLWWKDRLGGHGEIFIPIEAIKYIHDRSLELERDGFRERLESQTCPP